MNSRAAFVRTITTPFVTVLPVYTVITEYAAYASVSRMVIKLSLISLMVEEWSHAGEEKRPHILVRRSRRRVNLMGNARLVKCHLTRGNPRTGRPFRLEPVPVMR